MLDDASSSAISTFDIAARNDARAATPTWRHVYAFTMAPTAAEARAFQAVRPVCVALMRHTGAPQVAPEVAGLLATLVDTTRALQKEAPLATPLVHYIFQPLAQLLRMRPTGFAGLPDRVRELVMEMLALLAHDWWEAWTWAKVQRGAPVQPTLSQVPAWAIWEQLVLLGVSAVSTQGNSDATLLAVAHLLTNLLTPHMQPIPAHEGEWEWDGESALPSLDHMDSEPTERQIYPALQHIHAARTAPACLGALSHALKVALDTSRDTARPVALRSAMLDVATVASVSWLVGATHFVEHGPVLTLQKASTLYRYPASTAQEEWAARAMPILPGIVSTAVKVAASRQGAPGRVVARALRLMAALVVLGVADSVTASLRTLPETHEPAVHSLEDLAYRVPEAITEDGESVASELSVSDIDTPATSVDETDGRVVRDTVWLERTMRPILLALFSLDVSSARDDAEAQHALVECITTVLHVLPHTLAWAWRDAVGEPGIQDPQHRLVLLLLDMASQAHRTSVMQRARAAIEALVTADPRGWMACLGDHLHASLASLPAAVRGVEDGQAVLLAQRIHTLAELVAGPLAMTQLAQPHTAFLAEFATSRDVAQWGDALAMALAVHPRMAPAESDTQHTLELRPLCPPLEQRTVHALGTMLGACGRCMGSLVQRLAQPGSPLRPELAFASLLFFVQQGTAVHALATQRHSTASLFLANEQLLGLVDVLTTPDMELYQSKSEGRTLRKAVHALARRVVQQVLAVWTDKPDGTAEESVPEQALATPHDPVPEVVRGLPAERTEAPVLRPGAAVDVGVLPNVRLDQAVSKELYVVAPANLAGMHDSLLLALLASCASLLGVSFRPLLLHTLYPVLSALGSDDRLLHTTAEEALRRIAHACAYPSAASCVLHHADYILGAASHRLVAGLRAELHAGITQMEWAHAVEARRDTGRVQTNLLGARSAPWVLVEVLEMLGADVLPLVEDAVDEVLDALDRFHGYDDVCNGLLAVLARVMHVLAAEQEATAPPIQSAAPLPEDPFAELATWMQARSDQAHAADGGPPSAPAEDPPADAAADDDPNPDPSRLQTVVTQMVARSVPFVSHGSARLRVRALAMLASGVRILAPQQRTSDLYPILHRAWPLVMARLGMATTGRSTLPHLRGSSQEQRLREALPREQDANVWLAATTLVGTIGAHASDVFGRAILEQAWPRWARLLYVCEQFSTGRPAPHALPASHDDSALMPRANHTFRVYDVHGTLGQVLLAIMEALVQLVRSRGELVESAVLWAMATHPVLLDTLDTRQAKAVQDAGTALYRALAGADANLVWVVLRAVATDAPPHYLHRRGATFVPFTSLGI